MAAITRSRKWNRSNAAERILNLSKGLSYLYREEIARKVSVVTLSTLHCVSLHKRELATEVTAFHSLAPLRNELDVKAKKNPQQ